jgi:hypothetical protein
LSGSGCGCIGPPLTPFELREGTGAEESIDCDVSVSGVRKASTILINGLRCFQRRSNCLRSRCIRPRSLLSLRNRLFVSSYTNHRSIGILTASVHLADCPPSEHRRPISDSRRTAYPRIQAKRAHRRFASLFSSRSYRWFGQS